MLSRAPDAAARGFIYSAAMWLAVAGTALGVAFLKPVLPGFLAGEALSYPRVLAVGSIAMQYGWLVLASLAAIFYITPRLTGVRIRSEAAGQATALLINLVLIVGIPLVLATGPDAEFSELPPYLDVVLVVAMSLAAVTVFRTIMRRTEGRLYVSLWFFVGALIWGPLAMAAGNLQGFPGVAGSIAHLFGVNATFHLFFAAAGIGALYYVVPRASGGPLWSHRLGIMGFWVLGLAAPLTSAARVAFGPVPDWLETIAIAGSIALLVVVLTVVANLLGTLRGAWGQLPDHPSLRFLVGGTVLWAIAMLLGTLQSLRTVARVAGTTDWVTGQMWLLLLSFSLWFAGLIVYAAPKLMGRRWMGRTMLTSSFWLSFLGAAFTIAGALGSGLVAAVFWVAGVASERPLNLGRGWDLLLDGVIGFRVIVFLGFAAVAAGGWLFTVLLVKTTVHGDPHPLEVVAPPELVGTA